ncbi:MAG: C4-dicarboxylate ABC transporter substrate-binding protein [marine bacterium B5-7]|nr:MAG: C4-dicarboxylate ABC transporter substrate-binding protein [marine bacterium B5-7]
MKTPVRTLALGIALSSAITFSHGAHAEYNLTLCGASPGGLWSLIGAGVDAALKEAQPGSTVTYQTSGGGFANVVQIDQEKCDLALIHDAEAKAAINGQDPFDKPISTMRTIATIYTWAPMQMIVNKSFAEENGITTLEDIAKNEVPIRILLNRRGNVASGVGESMLNAAGASVENLEKWGGAVTFAASKEQGEMMRDRRADAMLNSLFVNHRSIRQLAEAIDLALVPISQKTADSVAKEWTIGEYTIPADAYDWADKDTLTVTLSAQLFVREDADDTMVKDLTAALIDHIDAMQGVHKAMAPLTAELMASAKAVPYHPAAVAVYKDKGLM